MDDRHGFAGDTEESKVEEMLAICNDDSLLKLSLNTHSISSSSDSLVLDSDLLARLHRLKSPPPPIPNASEAANPPADPQEIDILGAHLASRLAALKQPSLRPSSPLPNADAAPKHLEAPLPPPPPEKGLPSADLSSLSSAPDVRSRRNEELYRGANSFSSSDASEVEKLLASVKDQVRLAKASGEQKAGVSDDDAADEAKDSEDEISDSDVDVMVDWAKDAARLGVSEDDEGEADPVLDKGVRDKSTPSVSSRHHPAKKTTHAAKKMRKGWKFW